MASGSSGCPLHHLIRGREHIIALYWVDATPVDLARIAHQARRPAQLVKAARIANDVFSLGYLRYATVRLVLPPLRGLDNG